MSKLEELCTAASELSDEELRKLRHWLDELEAQRFDAQIERDIKAGKLDKLAAEALAEDRAGRTRDL